MISLYDAFLESARIASSNGAHAVACLLYEKALSWKEGDPLLDLKSQFGAEPIDFIARNINRWTSAGEKIQAIKEVRNVSNLGLKEAKDAVEYVAEKMDLKWVKRGEVL